MNVKNLRALQLKLKAATTMEIQYSDDLIIRANVGDHANSELVFLDPRGATISLEYLTPTDLHTVADVKQHFAAWLAGTEEEPLPPADELTRATAEPKAGTLAWYNDIARRRVGGEKFSELICAVRVWENFLIAEELAGDQGPQPEKINASCRKLLERGREQLGEEFMNEWGQVLRRSLSDEG